MKYGEEINNDQPHKKRQHLGCEVTNGGQYDIDEEFRSHSTTIWTFRRLENVGKFWCTKVEKISANLKEER